MRLYTRTGDGGTSGLLGGGRRPKTDVVFAALGDVDELCCTIGVAAAHLRLQLEAAERRADAGAGDDAPSPTAGTEASSVALDLVDVQSRLFDLGSVIASADTPEVLPSSPFDPPSVGGRRAAALSPVAVALERRIDDLSDSLPRLRDFILPSGSLAGAQLHLARAVARRAERSVAVVAEAQRARELRRGSQEHGLGSIFGSCETEGRTSAGSGSLGPALDRTSSTPHSSSSPAQDAAAAAAQPSAACRLACALVYLNRLSDYLFAAARVVNAAKGIAETTWRQLRTEERVDA